MDWITLSLIAALLWAISNLIDKILLEKWVKNPFIPLNIIGVINIIAVIFIFLIHEITPLSPINLLLALLDGILYMIAAAFYFKALELEEVSRIVPLFNLGPLLILILATIFLGEIFTPLKYIGIFLMVAGSILITVKKEISFGKSAFFLAVCLITSAMSQVIGKYLLGFADYWSIFAYVRFGIIIGVLPFCYLSIRDLIKTVKQHGSRVILAISASETLAIVATFIFTIAVSLGPVTLVNTLSSVQSFFVLVVAVLLSRFLPNILKEEISTKTILLKVVASLLLFIGAVLVA